MKEAARLKLQKFLALMGQPTSMRGLVVVLTGCGIALKPEHSDAITSGGLILAGLVGIAIEKG